MTAAELAQAMRARKHGSYWLARCVVHNDRNPSVSIRQIDGKVRLRCFAGCETRDILNALGLSFRDLGYQSDPGWKKRIRTAAVKPAGTRKPLGKLEATYRYTDEHGQLVAEKLRFEGKVFLWRRPNAGGGWLWRVDRSSLPLYRLHDIVTAKAVYLVEGEKDADRLASLGVVATTAPNGAKSWREDFAGCFRGKRVWIIPDSDAPGRAYANLAARSIAPVCACIRVVSVAPAKDVSAYLDAHRPSDLAALLKIAPAWRNKI